MARSVMAWLLVMWTAVLHPAAAQAPQPGAGELLAYELVVERAGTKSQGTRGRLYADDGSEVPPLLSLEPVQTPFGQFRYGSCSYLWSDCGYFRIAPSPNYAVGPSDPAGPRTFRVFRRRDGADYGYRGEVADSRVPIEDSAPTVDSPLGRFRRCIAFAGLPWSGWIPDWWLDKAARASCAGEAVQSEPDLANTQWDALPDTPFLTTPAATISFKPGRVLLFLGCNSAEGTWDATGNGELHVNLGGKTKMNCPDAIDNDTLFGAFDRPLRYEVDGEKLYLFDMSGGLVATLCARSDDPALPLPGERGCLP